MSERIDGPTMQELVKTYRETRDAAVKAENALYDYFWKPLLGFVRSITNGQGATDQAHSAARRFLASLDKELPRHSKAFLLRIARNRVLENGRRDRPIAINPERIDEMRGDESPVVNEVLMNEIAANLAAKNDELIDSMGERDRLIIPDWLSTGHARQTAERIGCSEADVDRAVARYRKLILRSIFS
jgi:DNA-directed RNA polymerase specialized sigma24 family protein